MLSRKETHTEREKNSRAGADEVSFSLSLSLEKKEFGLEIREGVWWAAFGKKEMSIFSSFLWSKIFFFVLFFIFFKQVGGLKTHTRRKREKKFFVLRFGGINKLFSFLLVAHARALIT